MFLWYRKPLPKSIWCGSQPKPHESWFGTIKTPQTSAAAAAVVVNYQIYKTKLTAKAPCWCTGCPDNNYFVRKYVFKAA